MSPRSACLLTCMAVFSRRLWLSRGPRPPLPSASSWHQSPRLADSRPIILICQEKDSRCLFSRRCRMSTMHPLPPPHKVRDSPEAENGCPEIHPARELFAGPRTPRPARPGAAGPFLGLFLL